VEAKRRRRRRSGLTPGPSPKGEGSGMWCLFIFLSFIVAIVFWIHAKNNMIQYCVFSNQEFENLRILYLELMRFRE
jgi:hypothetical protein